MTSIMNIQSAAGKYGFGPSRKNIDDKLAFTNISEEDVQRLREIAPFIKKAIPGICKNFMVELSAFPEVNAYFPKDETVHRLGSKLINFWEELFKAKFDAEYHESRLKVGQVHDRHGIQFNYYIDSYSYFIEMFLEKIRQIAKERRLAFLPLSQSFMKVVLLDIDIVSCSYFTRREETLSKYAGSLNSLVNISTRLIGYTDLSNLLFRISSDLSNDVKSSLTYIYDEEQDNFAPLTSTGLNEKQKNIFQMIRPTEKEIGDVDSLIRDGAKRDIIDQIKMLKENYIDVFSLKEIMILPAYISDTNYGFIILNKDEPFDEDQKKIIQSVYDQAKVVCENIGLIYEVQDTYKDTILALAQGIEARDAYTGEHVHRVAKHAERVARKMGLNEHDVENIRYGAILHDIGKLAVPDMILRKKERLTRQEFATIATHSYKGAEIVESIERLKDISPYVLHHEERYDGKGYPKGLAGDEIPLGARIIAVVDTYDAMTSNRPYRKAIPKERAKKILKKIAGTQLDPQIVDVFLEWFEEEKKSDRIAG